MYTTAKISSLHMTYMGKEFNSSYDQGIWRIELFGVVYIVIKNTKEFNSSYDQVIPHAFFVKGLWVLTRSSSNEYSQSLFLGKTDHYSGYVCCCFLIRYLRCLYIYMCYVIILFSHIIYQWSVLYWSISVGTTTSILILWIGRPEQTMQILIKLLLVE